MKLGREAPQNFVAKAIFLDFDATVIEEETLVVIGQACGLETAMEKLTDLAMQGKLDFVQALLKRVELLKGQPLSLIQNASTRLTLTKGIKELSKKAHKKNIPLFIVSGGFDLCVKPIAELLQAKDFAANQLEILDKRLTGNLLGKIVDEVFKKKWVEKKSAELGIPLNSVIYIGDGANDIEALKVVGLAVGFRPKPALLPHLHLINESGDHRELMREGFL